MENNKFEELGIIEPILKSIRDQHFKEPTDIQAKTIPLIIQGKDVIGGSKTGSGKTLAFSCGIIQNSERKRQIQALILVPTRELAEQVAEAFKSFSTYKKLIVAKVYGGVAIDPQIKKLEVADVVIGTPGRILDHMDRNTINIRSIKTLVLDEADMMLDMGFLPDVEQIIRDTPRTRQTLMFSATINDDILYIQNKYLNNPVKISVEEQVDPSQLDQIYYDVPSKQKFSLLVHLLKQETEGMVMVFCNTRQNTDFIGQNLKANGIKNRVIHGGLTQNKRTQIMEEFHGGKVYALICTDVAGRGLDIKGVSHVYNYDTCRDPKQYIHRIGRTARAGKNGKAITILSDRDYDNFTHVLQYNRIKIRNEETPTFERAKIEFKTAPSGRGGFGSGGRGDPRWQSRGPPGRQSRGPPGRQSRSHRGQSMGNRPRRGN